MSKRWFPFSKRLLSSNRDIKADFHHSSMIAIIFFRQAFIALMIAESNPS